MNLLYLIAHRKKSRQWRDQQVIKYENIQSTQSEGLLVVDF